MLIGLAGGVAVLGVTALFLARTERKGSFNRLLPLCTALFLASIVGTLVVSVARWTPPTATARSSSQPSSTHASLAQVLSLVQSSDRVRSVPGDIDVPPSSAVSKPPSDWGGTRAGNCGANLEASTVPACVFGDTNARRTIVLYGDSHAEMWFTAVDDIALRDSWRLVFLAKGACPASDLVGHLLAGVANEVHACQNWHSYVAARINRLHPDVLILTQDAYEKPDGSQYTPGEWRDVLASTLGHLHAGRTVVLGNIPASHGPACLLKETVSECSTNRDAPVSRFIPAERAAALSVGASYVDVTPWFCTRRCSPIIGRYDVYFDHSHVALGYTEYLEGVLAQALGV